MSLESMQAMPCPGCNIRIFWLEYHAPHCPNPNNHPVMNKLKEGSKVVGRN